MKTTKKPSLESATAAAPAAPPAPSPLMKVREVAAELQCSERYVWELRRMHRLKAVKLGGRCTRFRRADVEALIANARNAKR